MCRAHIGDPIAHGLVDCFLQRRLTRGNRNNLGAQKLHPRDIQRLTLHIHDSHVDDTFESEPCRHCSGRDPVLSGTGLGDDPPLSHSPAKNRLADGVVNLVRAGMQQILAFQINPGPPKPLTKALCKIQRGRTSAIVGQQGRKLLSEFRIEAGLLVFALQFIESADQGFRNKSSAVWTEMAMRVGKKVGSIHHARV